MGTEALSEDEDNTTTATATRRNLIRNSRHRDEYVRMLKAGWSPATMSLYASKRYEEDISESTFRRYRKRCKIKTPITLEVKNLDLDTLVDPVKMRMLLIGLQQERIGIDLSHERTMNKLFTTTRHEIRELSALISEYQEDLERFGLLVNVVDTTEAAEPVKPGEVVSLSTALGLPEGANVIDIARRLHEKVGQDKQTGAPEVS